MATPSTTAEPHFTSLDATFVQSERSGNPQETDPTIVAKPVVRLVHSILLEALRRNASDIHIRPGEKDVELIFRIDGDLVPVQRFPRKLLQAIVGRIKILGVMDITEHRKPQDGQLRITYEYMVATPGLRRLIPLTQHAIGLARSREIPLQEADLTRLE